MKITAYNLVRAIDALPKNRNYNYITESTHSLFHIDDVALPAGPVFVKRWNPNKGETYQEAKKQSISSEMIWRVANAINEKEAFNIDRILGASYNTRSVLETLIALTPEFYYCYPGRIMDVDGHTTIERGHKHLIWLPETPHVAGRLVEKEVPDMAISEIPLQTVTYDNLIIPPDYVIGEGETSIEIEVVRRHTQMQIALYLIGKQLGFKTWIAQNDQGIIYGDTPLREYPEIVKSLDDEPILAAFAGATRAARLIDCVWFSGQRFMPAVLEVEHSTGVTSGLTRMKGLMDEIPSIRTRYVVVASDDLRDKVIEQANRPQFVGLDTRFFSYSSVEELYHICTHRNLHGVTEEFLDCFMEKVVV